MSGRTPQRQQLMDLLGPVITSHDCDLEELSVSAAGRRSLIRIVVDSVGGIDLDTVAELSRAVSEILDAEPSAGPEFAGPYVLEVSSPGVDRPLTELRHWRRAAGRLVSVSVGDQTVTGRVEAVEGSDVVLRLGDARQVLPLGSLGVGRIQVEFARPDQAEQLAAGDDPAAGDHPGAVHDLGAEHDLDVDDAADVDDVEQEA